MPLLNFTCFQDEVESGIKKLTIRKEYKIPINVNDTLYLYTGLRTKKARLLKKTICKNISKILINLEKNVIINDIELNKNDLIKLSKNDGYKSVEDFINFFEKTYNLPFKGVIIEW